ncbi:MAG: 1-acyl-sn-glycerol-3-phosphate acyltransferase [Alphaproteobacteria bacterium]|nr:1-acyl-sn-glycerol-3-phosphate acyltransferase [Alphaproteobacteria bacterium]MCB9793606.1 1-acyl-sn-glycerol-3-phosphate acyltransferase [Alphaproteobacteria bacterium]
MTELVPTQLPLHRRLLWRAAWLLVAGTVGVALRVKRSGQENIPEEGGALLVANHTTAIDFMMPIWGAWRPVFAIGSEQVFKLPVAGWLLRQLNGVPISQGVKDRAAVHHLVKAYEGGHIVMMFPEGKRSWTGRPLPVTPGTGRLVASLGCPVVHCRIRTGHLFHPRWARYPRFVPWHMHYDPPVSYPEGTPPEEITADMERRIAIDVEEIEAPRFSWGFRLAEGLPRFLWACPSCFTTDALEVLPEDRDSVRCRACQRAWRVDLSAKLNPHGGGERISVAAAHARVSQHFGAALDPARFAAEGVALETARGQVSRIARKQPEPERVAEGRLRLCAHHLEILDEDGASLWSLPYTELKAAILEFRSMLVLRTAEGALLLEPGEESPHKWHHFLTARVRADGLRIRT